MIDGEQGEALQGEREGRRAIGEGAVAVEVAAGSEVSLEGRGTLPHLAAAAGEAVVGGGELLVAHDPEALGEEGQKEERGKTLRPPDVDAREGHAAMARRIDLHARRSHELDGDVSRLSVTRCGAVIYR